MSKKINKNIIKVLGGIIASSVVNPLPANATEDVVHNTSIKNSGLNSKSLKTGIVNTDVLNVRQGAGTSYLKIGSLRKGSSVQIIETINGWHKIKYETGYGYVSSSYVLVSSSTQQPQPSTSIVATGVTSDALNVRNGASTSYSKIGLLNKNEKVNIVEKLPNGWYKIKYGTGYGYVSGTYVKNVISANDSQIESSENISTATKVIYTATVNVSSADTLNVRNTGSVLGSVIGVLHKDEKVQIVDKMNNGWSKIKYGAGYGYVNTSYLKNISSSSSETVLPVLKTGKVTTDTLNVRNGASTSNSVIGKLSRDTKVEIVETSTNGWYKIKYGTGYGYVSNLYISIDGQQRTNLNNFLFVGDSFTVLLSNTIKSNNNNVYIHAKSGSMPSYWLDKVSSMPSNSNVDGVVLLIGVNGAGYESNKADVKTLINKLSAKYPNKTIYVQKIFPVGKNFKSANPTTFNSKINSLNSVIKTHCQSVKNATFIDTTSGFVDSNGYLINTNDGLHISSSYNSKFYSNILNAIKLAENR